MTDPEQPIVPGSDSQVPKVDPPQADPLTTEPSTDYVTSESEPADTKRDETWVDPRSDKEEKPARSSGGSVLKDLGISLVAALILSILLKTFLIQAFYIPSVSMADTLLEGDRVLANKLVPDRFDLHRGDIVVFKDPGGWLHFQRDVSTSPLVRGLNTVLTFIGLKPDDSDDNLIKRVIGLPGDHVTCCDAQGRLTINGVSIDETYIAPGDVPSEKTFDVTVPNGKLWVMGDHRSDSEDSRYNEQTDNGFVPIDNVVGVAFVIIWPASRWQILNNPSDVFANVPSP